MNFKLSNQFQIIASLTTMGLLFLLSYVSYITPESRSLQVAEKMLERNTGVLEEYPILCEHYLISGNRNTLVRLRKAIDSFEKTIGLLDSGGTFMFQEQEYILPIIKDLDYRRRLGEFSTQFRIHREKITVIENQPLYVEDENKGLSIVHRQNASFQNVEMNRNLNEQVYEAYEYIASANRIINTRAYTLTETVHDLIEEKKSNSQLFRFIIMTITALLAARVTVLVVMNYIRPMEHVVRKAAQLSGIRRKSGYNHVRFLSDSLNNISSKFQDASHFVSEIGEGNFGVELLEVKEKEPIGQALLQMRDRLKSFSTQEKDRSWLNHGLTEVADILNENQKDSFEELSFQFIQLVVKHLEMNQGGVFLLDDRDKLDIHIRLYGSFAYNKRKQLNKRIELRDGLIGQCIEEGEPIYMKEVPSGYMTITSGLGEATPGYLLLVPIRHEGGVLGAVEVASFLPISNLQREFMTEATSKLGAIVSVVQTNQRTQALLEQSQYINQALQAKETQMRKNTKELEKTQGELNIRLEELKKESNLVKNIVDAINKTNATIEFDLKGNIIDVNDIYISIMGYEKSELVGKNEKVLVPQDELESGRYQLLWDSLENGSFISGEYRRVTSNGREVWLNGTYNPIFDIYGKVYKVIQFAQFTTEEKEKDLDFIGKINAISADSPFLDLNLDGNVASANQTFLKWLGYTRMQIRRKPFEEILYKDQKVPEGFWERLKEGESPVMEFDLPTFSGDTLKHAIVKFHPLRNLSGEYHKIMTIFIDITESKKLELKLKAEQEKLEAALAEKESQESVLEDSVMRFELDFGGRFLMTNDRLTETLGHSSDATKGTRLTKYFANEPQVDAFEKYFRSKSKEVKRLEVELSTKNSGSFWADISLGPLFGANDTIRKYIGVMLDVSEKVKQQQALELSLQKERMQNALFREKLTHPEAKTSFDQALDKMFLELEKEANFDTTILLEKSSLPTLLIERDTKIVKANSVAIMLGIDATLEGVRLSDILKPTAPGSTQEPFINVVQEQVMLEKEFTLELKKGAKEVRLITIPLFGTKAQQSIVILEEIS